MKSVEIMIVKELKKILEKNDDVKLYLEVEGYNYYKLELKRDLIYRNKNKNKYTRLRLGFEDGYIVITNVIIAQTRQGTMTKVYTALNKYVLDGLYEGIVFKCVVSKAMEDFCKKNNLNRVNQGVYNDWVKNK